MNQLLLLTSVRMTVYWPKIAGIKVLEDVENPTTKNSLGIWRLSVLTLSASFSILSRLLNDKS